MDDSFRHVTGRNSGVTAIGAAFEGSCFLIAVSHGTCTVGTILKMPEKYQACEFGFAVKRAQAAINTSSPVNEERL
jgi:hypothetical protein